jgi:hypothetical protein
VVVSLEPYPDPMLAISHVCVSFLLWGAP